MLGKLACLVLSKILGIGSAERNCKQVKNIKRGDCTQTGIDKTAKQVLVYAQYQMLHGKLRKTALLCAGKLWEDTDFDCMKWMPIVRTCRRRRPMQLIKTSQSNA